MSTHRSPHQTGIPWSVLAAIFGTVGIFALLASAKTLSNRRIALIGDSYAVGLGPILTRVIAQFKYEGHVGIGTHTWVACDTCGNWLASYAPSLVLVSLGVNDGNAPNSIYYREILKNMRNIGARVVWIEPPAGVNTPAVRQTIASLGVETVPATTTPLGADGLHPASYSPWANQIASQVAPHVA